MPYTLDKYRDSLGRKLSLNQDLRDEEKPDYYKSFYDNPWLYDQTTVKYLKSDNENLQQTMITEPQTVASADMAYESNHVPTPIDTSIYAVRVPTSVTADVDADDAKSRQITCDMIMTDFANQNLWMAIQRKNLRLMIIALQQGAKPDAIYAKCENPLSWHIFQSADFNLICCLAIAYPEYVTHAIYFAIAYNDMYALDFLLSKTGNINSSDIYPEEGTPLEMAVRFCRHLAVSVLLLHGAKITDRAFEFVCQNRMFAIFNTFMSFGYRIGGIGFRVYEQANRNMVKNSDLLAYLTVRGFDSEPETECECSNFFCC